MKTETPYTVDMQFLKTCENFRDCSGECCLEYDPGSVSVENLQIAKFPTTKSNVCLSRETFRNLYALSTGSQAFITFAGNT